MILSGDSQKTLPELNSESVDLVITSPPYKNVDGYTKDLIRTVFTECFRLQKNNTLAFINFGHLKEDKNRPFEVKDILLDIGYKLYDTIIWVKNHYTPLRGNNLNNLYEFIFMMYKGEMPTMNRLAIGIPYTDKSNIGRYSDKDIKCRSNLWFVNYKTIQNKSDKLHKDRFPVEIPELCIKLSDIPDGSIVLDPFAGSGSTGVAAKKLNKNYILLEKDKNNVIIIQNKMKGIE